MVEMKTIKEVWEYDIGTVETIYENLRYEDPELEILDGKDPATDDKVVLKCRPSTKFEYTFSLSEISPVFTMGSILVVSDGETVTATLKSKTARAWGWTKNRIYLSATKSLGINGYDNLYIDTEDDLSATRLNGSSKFIDINVLATSKLPFTGDRPETVTLNIDTIDCIIPINLFEWLAMKEEMLAKKKKNK